MTLDQIGILLAIAGSGFSMMTTVALGVYAFAVLRTMVQQHDKSLESVALQLRVHMADDNKHHNERASREFEARMDQKFESLEKEMGSFKETMGREIGEVKVYCEEIDAKLDRRAEAELERQIESERRQADRGPHGTQ